MDRFHARASMVFWTLLNYRQYQPTPLPVRKEFDKRFVHVSQIDFSIVEQALADQKLLVIDPTALYPTKPGDPVRLVRWPAVVASRLTPEHFTIQAQQFLSPAQRLQSLGDVMIRMPLHSRVGALNLAVLDALWVLLGGSDAYAPRQIFSEPQLIATILHVVIGDHPEATAGDVHCLLHSRAIQTQWLECVPVLGHPEDIHYRRRQTLQRPCGKANQLHYQQPSHA